MSSRPLVTIVVNNFNYELFVARAIESALDQSYPSVEVVVVDDGSTDGSRDVIARYRDRVRAIFKENGGQASTFNVGFEEARGDIVCYLDADDWLRGDAIETAVETMEASGAAKVHWPLEMVDEHEQPLGRLFPSGELAEGELIQQVIDCGPFYDTYVLPPTSGNAWRRNFLAEMLPVPEDGYPTGADVYLHTLAPLAGPAARVTTPLGYYRVHGRNQYWNRQLDDGRIDYYARRFEKCCEVLAARLELRGIHADVERWKRKNWNHVWLERLRRARQDIRSLVPPGQAYVIVDDAEWSLTAPIPDRRAFQFIDKEGRYGGSPPDDATAISELERVRGLGARHIFFWFTSFWWLDTYPGLRDHLEDSYERVMENDHIIAYRL